MSEFTIKNLHVTVDSKEVIQGISLNFKKGFVYALLGPNGSGKSSLAMALMGDPRYVIKGKILFNGDDISKETTTQRARRGLFLSFQNPLEFAGVSIGAFLRTAVNTVKGKNISVLDFQKLLLAKMELLNIDPSFARRSLNEGFSGGEKKRLEILQLLLLEPQYAILDETDSGLDVDAMKTVAKGIHLLQQETKMGIIIVTHNPRFLQYLKPERVDILSDGKIVASGQDDLLLLLEKEGFAPFIKVKK